jgi:hypothetical protein
MERTKRRTAIGIGITLAIGVAALVAWRVLAWERPSVDVSCSQLDNPGMGRNDFGMTFTVTTRGRAAATALIFEIADTNLEGKPTGEISTYTLTGPFSPGPPTKILKDDVPAPPHYRPAKFSKLDCTLIHATFDDGTHW